MDQDHSQTLAKIILYYSFRMFKLLSSILLSSYFLGIIFFIFCDLTMHMSDDEDALILFFKLENYSLGQVSLTMTYYMLTTLSTIGFGDIVPRSDAERVFIVIIMAFAILIINYIKYLLHVLFHEIK